MIQKSINAFTLLELLVVIGIISVIAAIGIPAFNNYQIKAKISAAKSNHVNLVTFTKAQAIRCTNSLDIELNGTTGRANLFKCGSPKASIANFRLAINHHVYGSFKNPFPPSNGSRCRPNVDNCQPPGYLNGCSISGRERYGMMGIIVSSPYEITICTNIGPTNLPSSATGEVLIDKIRFIYSD